MRSTTLVRTIRSAAWTAVLALGALMPVSTIGAQTVSAAYAPFNGPGTGSGLVRFGITNTTGAALLFNSLTLTSTSPFTFATTSGAGVGTYIAVDQFGEFVGSSTVTIGGSRLFIDFPVTSGFQFSLGAGGSGYVQVGLAGTPVALTAGAFTFAATAEGVTAPIGGAVTVAAASTVPEPSTYALLATGLGTLGLIARRRRAA